MSFRTEPSLLDTVVGQLALRRGVVDPTQLTDCLSEGGSAPLGQVLVRRRLISPTHLLELMREAERVQLSCTGCGRTFPYAQLDPIGPAACPVCGQRVLPAAAPPAGASDMNQTLAMGAGPPRAARVGSSRRTRKDTTRSGAATGRFTKTAGEFGGVFGPYELLEELGRGGMGVVFKARQAGLDRLVAVKILLGGDLASKHQIARFQREGEITARLKHPHIVQIHDVGTVLDHRYFAMDLIEGLPLSKLIKRKQLNVRRALEIACDVARALDHAHARGVIHRDIKPANVVIDREGSAILTDFGLARERDPDMAEQARLTRSGALVGTPYYMSPEQASGKSKQVGAGADIYSLGVVLYEMLTYELPFLADTQLELTEKIVGDEPPRPSEFVPDLDRDVETIVLKALAKTPEARYETAGDLADDLERVLRGDRIVARRRGLVLRLWERVRRRRRGALLAAASVLAVVGSTLAVIGVVTRLQRAEELRLAKAEAERKRKARLAEEAEQEAAEEAAARGAVEAAHAALRRAALAPAGEEWRAALEGAVRRLTSALGNSRNTKDAALLLLRGRAQERLRALDTATRDYERVIQLDPTGVAGDEARFLLGRLHLREDEDERGHEVLQTAAGPPSAWRDLASALLTGVRDKDPAGALVAAQRAEQRRPDDPDVLGVQGQALIALRRGKEALLVLERAVEVDAKDAHLWAHLASVRLIVAPPRGKQDLERALRLDPDHATALLLRANELGAQGKHQDAIKDLRRVLGQRPRNVDVLFALANLYKATKQPTLLTQMLERMERFAPRDPRPYRFRGLSYLLELEFRRALGELRLGIRRCYDDPEARQDLTELFQDVALETRQIEVAEDYVRDRLALAPGDPDALCFRAQSLLSAERPDEAKALLAEVRENHPEHADAWKLQLKFGVTTWGWDPERLLTAMQRFEATFAADAESLAWLAQLVVLIPGVSDGAERGTALARRALEIDPDCADAVLVLGLMAMSRGQVADAKQAFLRVLSIDDEHRDAMTVLGVIAFNEGDSERAMLFLNRVLAREPFRANALEGLILINLKARRLREATDVAQRYLDYCRLARRPPTPELLTLYVQCKSRAGRADEGLRAFEEIAARYYAELPEYKVGLAQAYASAGKLERAKETLDAVLADHPQLEPAIKLKERLGR